LLPFRGVGGVGQPRGDCPYINWGSHRDCPYINWGNHRDCPYINWGNHGGIAPTLIGATTGGLPLGITGI